MKLYAISSNVGVPALEPLTLQLLFNGDHLGLGVEGGDQESML
jgi:hypothetical protein